MPALIVAAGADTLPHESHGAASAAFSRSPPVLSRNVAIARGHPFPMSKIAGLLVALLLAVIVGGGLFLSTWNPPAPSAKIEKVVPDARFPR